jgi:hypothetical protein
MKPACRAKPRRPFSLLALAVLASATGACKRTDKPPTQIVLRLDSQLEAMTDVQAISVRVRRTPAGAVVFSNQFTVSAERYALPGELGLVAASEDDNGPVYIEVQTQLTRGGFFTTNVESHFIPRRVRVVPILLTRDCASRTSMMGGGTCASCSACGCDPVRADVDGGAPGGEYVEMFAPDRDESGCQLAHPPVVPPDLLNLPSAVFQPPPFNTPLPPRYSLTQRCTNGPCFAVRRLQFDWPTTANPNRWAKHGWDLDSTCTTPSRAMATCRNPGGVVNDGDNGRDNAFALRLGPFLQTLQGIGLSEETINAGIARGVATLGIELRNYNGTGDDSEIEAELFPLISGHAADDLTAPPRWDGTDVWFSDRTLTIAPEAAVSRGYVAGSRLVLRLRSQTPISFTSSVGQSRLSISGGIASGSVHCGGRQLGLLELGGFIEVRQLENELPFMGVCDPLQTFAVKTALQQSADLNFVGDAPVNNANVDCNAISFGVAIEPTPISRVLIDEDSPTTRTNPCDRDGGADASLPDASATDARATDTGASDARVDAAVDARG